MDWVTTYTDELLYSLRKRLQISFNTELIFQITMSSKNLLLIPTTTVVLPESLLENEGSIESFSQHWNQWSDITIQEWSWRRLVRRVTREENNTNHGGNSKNLNSLEKNETSREVAKFLKAFTVTAVVKDALELKM